MKRTSEWEKSLSVAIVLSNMPEARFGSKLHDALVMVKNREGLWGLPAGHVKPGESLEQACWRELKEETGINSNQVDLRISPKVIDIPGRWKTSVGFVYQGFMKEPLPEGDYIVVDDEDIVIMRPVGVDVLSEIERTGGVSLCRKEYNLQLITGFLNKVFDDPYYP